MCSAWKRTQVGLYRTSPQTSALLQQGMPWRTHYHLPIGEEEESQPTLQNKSTKRRLEPRNLQPGQHQFNISVFRPLLKRKLCIMLFLCRLTISCISPNSFSLCDFLIFFLKLKAAITNQREQAR